MNQEEVHDRYCDIVASNWAMEEFEYFSLKIRKHFYVKIVESDPDGEGLTFVTLWDRTFSLTEEVGLSAEAASVIPHPKDDA